jgi:hypothetical protein
MLASRRIAYVLIGCLLSDPAAMAYAGFQSAPIYAVSAGSRRFFNAEAVPPALEAAYTAVNQVANRIPAVYVRSGAKRARRRHPNGRFANEPGGSPDEVLLTMYAYYMPNEWVLPADYHSEFAPEVEVDRTKHDFRDNERAQFMSRQQNFDANYAYEYKLTDLGRRRARELLRLNPSFLNQVGFRVKGLDPTALMLLTHEERLLHMTQFVKFLAPARFLSRRWRRWRHWGEPYPQVAATEMVDLYRADREAFERLFTDWLGHQDPLCLPELQNAIVEKQPAFLDKLGRPSSRVEASAEGHLLLTLREIADRREHGYQVDDQNLRAKLNKIVFNDNDLEGTAQSILSIYGYRNSAVMGEHWNLNGVPSLIEELACVFGIYQIAHTKRESIIQGLKVVKEATDLIAKDLAEAPAMALPAAKAGQARSRALRNRPSFRFAVNEIVQRYESGDGDARDQVLIELIGERSILSRFAWRQRRNLDDVLVELVLGELEATPEHPHAIARTKTVMTVSRRAAKRIRQRVKEFITDESELADFGADLRQEQKRRDAMNRARGLLRVQKDLQTQTGVYLDGAAPQLPPASESIAPSDAAPVRAPDSNNASRLKMPAILLMGSVTGVAWVPWLGYGLLIGTVAWVWLVPVRWKKPVRRISRSLFEAAA